MWPWAHAALAYLLYSGYTHRTGGTPTPLPTIAVAVGAITPDVVDKPLAWTLQILPHGRSLMHSAITVTILSILVVYFVHDRVHPTPYYAFLAGLWVHVLSDGLPTFEHVNYLLWPLLEPHPATIEPSFIAHFQAIDPTPWFLTQLAITGVGIGVWIWDGAPGARVLARR